MNANNSARILVFGIGGVGGLLAAPLVKTYGDAVSLIARGARGEHIRQQGLTIHSDDLGNYTVYPAAVTDDPGELPEQDVVFLCVKNGNLEEAARQLRPAVGENTAVVPLMNGVSAGEVLRRELARGHICDGVIYTVSGIEPDQSIRQIGKITRVLIGADGDDAPAKAAAEYAAGLLAGAGVKCCYRENTRQEVWKKFVMNCAFNVVTAARGATTDEITADPQWTEEYRTLLTEAWQVSCAEGSGLDKTVVDGFMTRLFNYVPGSESSLSRDFSKHAEGEWKIFSSEVIRRAEKHGIDVPVTRQYEALMRERVESWK